MACLTLCMHCAVTTRSTHYILQQHPYITSDYIFSKVVPTSVTAATTPSKLVASSSAVAAVAAAAAAPPDCV